MEKITWMDAHVLEKCLERPFFVHAYRIADPVVVMGRSNKKEKEVFGPYCEAEGIPVMQRLGGGGTVVLYPGTFIVSLGAWVQHPFENTSYFRKLNQIGIQALERVSGQTDFCQKGISDICWGEKKIAGTSLFRSKNFLMYQASFLGTAEFDLVSRCLQHPSAEPDYRKGRNHYDFLTSLEEIVTNFEIELVFREWGRYWFEGFFSCFRDECCSVYDEQTKNLRQRLEQPRDRIPHLLQTTSLE